LGVLTDVVALRPEDAARVDAAQFDAATYGAWALRGKGIFDVELATLEEILTGQDAFEIIGEESEVLSDSGGFSIVFEAVRPSLTKALAERASTADWAAIADRWEETDELAGADLEALTEYVTKLADLAARAVAAERSLYLWICV